MSKGLLFVGLLFIAGCQAEWETAPVDYTCTPDQMARVITECEYCQAKTTFLKDYCYGSAIMRNCTKREAK